MDTLRELIAEGTVTEISAKGAGISPTVAAGEYLRFSLPWEGDDTEGVIWLYPDVSYAGTFRVESGRVSVTLDSSVIEAEGAQYAVFFGDSGTTVAVPFSVDGRISAVNALAQDGAATTSPPRGLALPVGERGTVALLWLLLIGGGGLVVLAEAGAGTVLLLRSRSVAAAAVAAT